MSDDEIPSANSPDLGLELLGYLDVLKGEYEDQFADATDPEAAALSDALDCISDHAFRLVTSVGLPPSLHDELAGFRADLPTLQKVSDLLGYVYVHDQVGFEVAYDVCGRLDGLPKRVLHTTLLSMILMRNECSPTVAKYFRRATQLYLAGYDAEAVIMCGAVLEAAMRDRIPDELLSEAGIKPDFERTGEFSFRQRREYERQKLRFLTSEQRQTVRRIVSSRNDAVHMQPDATPGPLDTLAHLTYVLPAILPG